VYPTTIGVTTTTNVPGSNPEVVVNIYSKVGFDHIDQIVQATQYTSTHINSCVTVLSDFLNLSTVVQPANLSGLAAIGITDFEGLGEFLNARVGQGTFSSWEDLAQFLLLLDIPSQNYTPTPATHWPPNPSSFSETRVLTTSAQQTINSQHPQGSGELKQPLIWDFLGASAGMPYNDFLPTMNASIGSDGGVMSALADLKTKVQTAIANQTPVITGGGDGGGTESDPEYSGNYLSGSMMVYKDTDMQDIIDAMTKLVSAVNSASTNPTAKALFTRVQTLLTKEHRNLGIAGAVFSTPAQTVWNTFSTNWVGMSVDKIKLQCYQYYDRIFTNDKAGDTLRATRSELINDALFSSRGIEEKNDPDPNLLAAQAQSMHTTMTQVIQQNK
jgi:hypothetical protein